MATIVGLFMFLAHTWPIILNKQQSRQLLMDGVQSKSDWSHSSCSFLIRGGALLRISEATHLVADVPTCTLNTLSVYMSLASFGMTMV